MIIGIEGVVKRKNLVSCVRNSLVLITTLRWSATSDRV